VHDPETPDPTYFGLSTQRLEAFSDGVLAIVVTLLVLNFSSADEAVSEASSSSEVLARLAACWPQLAGYVLSFVLIAIYWVLHHVMFHHIRRADLGLLWLNVLFLLTVALVPWPTDLLAKGLKHESNVIVFLYGLNHVAAGLLLAAIWNYAVSDRRLVPADLQDEVIRRVRRAALAAPLFHVVGIAASFWATGLGLAVFALTPLYHMVPTRWSELWLHPQWSRRTWKLGGNQPG
jgi:uncharacterized membrane protein